MLRFLSRLPLTGARPRLAAAAFSSAAPGGGAQSKPRRGGGAGGKAGRDKRGNRIAVTEDPDANPEPVATTDADVADTDSPPQPSANPRGAADDAAGGAATDSAAAAPDTPKASVVVEDFEGSKGETRKSHLRPKKKKRPIRQNSFNSRGGMLDLDRDEARAVSRGDISPSTDNIKAVKSKKKRNGKGTNAGGGGGGGGVNRNRNRNRNRNGNKPGGGGGGGRNVPEDVQLPEFNFPAHKYTHEGFELHVDIAKLEDPLGMYKAMLMEYPELSENANEEEGGDPNVIKADTRVFRGRGDMLTEDDEHLLNSIDMRPARFVEAEEQTLDRDVEAYRLLQEWGDGKLPLEARQDIFDLHTHNPTEWPVERLAREFGVKKSRVLGIIRLFSMRETVRCDTDLEDVIAGAELVTGVGDVGPQGQQFEVEDDEVDINMHSRRMIGLSDAETRKEATRVLVEDHANADARPSRVPEQKVLSEVVTKRGKTLRFTSI